MNFVFDNLLTIYLIGAAITFLLCVIDIIYHMPKNFIPDYTEEGMQSIGISLFWPLIIGLGLFVFVVKSLGWCVGWLSYKIGSVFR